MKDAKFDEEESFESFYLSRSNNSSFNENDQDFKQIMLTDTPDKYYKKKKKLIFS